MIERDRPELPQYRELQEIVPSELVRLWQEGIDSGPAVDARPVIDRLKMKYQSVDNSA